MRLPVQGIACLLLLLMALPAWSEGFQYEEGTHYAALEVPIKTRNPDVIEVTEYFSYGCPYCYSLEPLIRQWKQDLPADVAFNRTPAIWRVAGYELYARTYYTVLALGVLDKVHLPLFNALHSERRRLPDLEAMTGFMAEQGVDPVEFVKTYNDSFGVKASYQQAIARQRVYRASGVPAFIVNGKYRVEASMVGRSSLGMLQVVNYLIEKERQLSSADVPSGGE